MALIKSPCNAACIARVAPHPGQSYPVRIFKGHLGIQSASFGSTHPIVIIAIIAVAAAIATIRLLLQMRL